MKVIAAIDDTFAAGPVLSTARALSRLFGADVEALHVRQNGHATASREAKAARVSLETSSGSAVETLVAAAAADEVASIVVGTRRTPTAARPLGATALEVVASLEKPVAVVAPEAVVPERIRRVLLPLEGTASTSLAPVRVLELCHEADLDVVVLHVHDEGSLPLFTDQPQHETVTWTKEFLARYCPRGLSSVSTALRVGKPEEAVVGVAEDESVDLIALGWNQQLAPGRAEVVRAVLERGALPIMLIPAAPPERRIGSSPHASSVAAPIASSSQGRTLGD
jgi:nucleotide-binding universal stress UspA family protein